MKFDIKNAQKCKMGHKRGLWHIFCAFSSNCFVICLLYSSSPEKLKFMSFRKFSIMFNGIIHVKELTSSKFLDCRIHIPFLQCCFSQADCNLSLIRTLKVATELNMGIELHNSACCRNQAEFLTKTHQKFCLFSF